MSRICSGAILRCLAGFRSSHRRCSVRKGVLRNLTKFTGTHLCQSLFFNKVAALKPAALLKRRLWHRRFPVNFAKFLRTLFLQNISGRLFLRVLNMCLQVLNHSFSETFRIFLRQYPQ